MTTTDCDVVIIGSGIAGALAANELAKAGNRVLILEAGGVPPDSLGRWAMVHNFTNSPSKAPDSPFCGDDVLPIDPNVDPMGGNTDRCSHAVGLPRPSTVAL